MKKMSADPKHLEKELLSLFGDEKVLLGSAVTSAYSSDAYSVETFEPFAVVLPESTQEVADLVCWCKDNKIPLTPRGAGTGLSGGSMPALGGIVLSTKKLNKILKIEPEKRRLLAEAGCVNTHLSKAVEEYGLHFAPDPSSQSVSTLGGNIAENSGGPHTLKYGVTTQHILGITMVLGSGEVLEIENSPGYDLLSLVIGSEGTLGIVTEAWIKLTPNPAWVETTLICFPTVRSATESVAKIIRSGIVPAALEMMDRYVLEAVSKAYQVDFPEKTQAALLVECDGEKTQAQKEMNHVVEMCKELEAISTERAASETDRARLWTARKKGVGALGRIAPTVVTHDGVIPPSKLPEMLEKVYEVAEKYQLGVANIFHAGDGNLHPIFTFDQREPGSVERVVKAGEEIIEMCLKLGGSVTGEHGIGVEKTSLLEKMYNQETLSFQAQLKKAFHSHELVNPCKVIPDAKGCIEHKVRWRGAAT